MVKLGLLSVSHSVLIKLQFTFKNSGASGGDTEIFRIPLPLKSLAKNQFATVRCWYRHTKFNDKWRAEEKVIVLRNGGKCEEQCAIHTRCRVPPMHSTFPWQCNKRARACNCFVVNPSLTRGIIHDAMPEVSMSLYDLISSSSAHAAFHHYNRVWRSKSRVERICKAGVWNAVHCLVYQVDCYAMTCRWFKRQMSRTDSQLV